MATANELLENELNSDNVWFEIDLAARQIVIPKAVTNLGTKSEADVMHARFKLPRFYNGLDFNDFKIGIDYTNAQGEEDRYEPVDVSVTDDIVTFTWVVGRHAALYNGLVTFGLCAKRLNPEDPDNPLNEFHTTKASLPILDSMETCEEAILEHTDLLEQWRNQLFNLDISDAVLHTPQTLTEEQKAQARANIGAAAPGEGGGSVEGAVLYTEQTLTDEQKAQARANIGAAAPGEGGVGSVDGAVLYTEQTLLPEQKEQARENIGAIGDEIYDREYSTNLLDWNSVQESTTLGPTGKLFTGSSYSHYTTTAPIPCKTGDKIRIQFDYNGIRRDSETTKGYASMSRVAAYDASGNFVDGSYKTDPAVYTAPDGSAFVRIAFLTASFNVTYQNLAILIQDDATIKPYSEYGELITDRIRTKHLVNSVLHTEQSLTDEQKAQARANIGAISADEIEIPDVEIPDAVLLYDKQTLTEEQKAQARANIGAAGIGEGGVVDGGAVLYTPQTIAEEQKAQARTNIGAANALVAPRAQIRQIKHGIQFVDVYVPADWSYSTYSEQYRLGKVFGLEAHSANGTAQRVYESNDGGETWEEYCSLPMNAANGEWFTDFVVDYTINCIYALKTTDGGNNFAIVSFYLWTGDGKWHKRDTDIELGAKRLLSNNSFEICNYGSTRVAMFGEYGVTTDGTAYCLWRTTNGGATWNKVLEIVGDDNTSGTMVRGEIRHWHTVKADPFTQHIWAASGDTDSQCKIYRSTDGGVNWELMFSGSQRERTCGFVFEENCIYYGMDAKHGSDPNFTRIVKIDKSKLDTDRENCREDVAVVDSCRSVYGLTRTFYPDGFIVWTQQEPDSMFKSDHYTLQFYDYATKKLYPIAYFDISNIATTKYIGFYAGAKCQSLTSGVIFAKPTNSMHQEKYGFSFVSKHIKINLTM